MFRADNVDNIENYNPEEINALVASLTKNQGKISKGSSKTANEIRAEMLGSLKYLWQILPETKYYHGKETKYCTQTNTFGYNDLLLHISLVFLESLFEGKTELKMPGDLVITALDAEGWYGNIIIL